MQYFRIRNLSFTSPWINEQPFRQSEAHRSFLSTFPFRFYLRRAALARESERTGNVRLIGPFVRPRKPKGMRAAKRQRFGNTTNGFSLFLDHLLGGNIQGNVLPIAGPDAPFLRGLGRARRRLNVPFQPEEKLSIAMIACSSIVSPMIS